MIEQLLRVMIAKPLDAAGVDLVTLLSQSFEWNAFLIICLESVRMRAVTNHKVNTLKLITLIVNID